jgi:hypothetical protein
MIRFQFRQGAAHATEDDGQLIIEVVCRRGGDGARAFGSIEMFHDRIVLPRPADPGGEWG